MAAERRPAQPARRASYSSAEHLRGRCMSSDDQEAKLLRTLRKLATQAGGVDKLKLRVASLEIDPPPVPRRRGRPAEDDAPHLARMDELLRSGQAKTKNAAATIVAREAFPDATKASRKSIVARLSRKFRPAEVADTPREYRIRTAIGNVPSSPLLSDPAASLRAAFASTALDAVARANDAASLAGQAAARAAADVGPLQKAIIEAYASFGGENLIRALMGMHDTPQK
jgi:hypothetical protein